MQNAISQTEVHNLARELLKQAESKMGVVDPYMPAPNGLSKSTSCIRLNRACKRKYEKPYMRAPNLDSSTRLRRI
jgi:hypothetical protein